MPKTGAERQAKYKKLHSRINMVVSAAAVAKLKELSTSNGLPQKQVLEQLIMAADLAGAPPTNVAAAAAATLLSNAAETAETLLSNAADVAETLLGNAADNSMILRTNIAEVAAEAAEVAAAVLRRNADKAALATTANIAIRNSQQKALVKIDGEAPHL